MATALSRSITNDVSTSLPSTLPASAALARPGPIAAATSATDTGLSNGRIEPSGSFTLTINSNRRKKSAGWPHFFSEPRKNQHDQDRNAEVQVRGVITLAFFAPLRWPYTRWNGFDEPFNAQMQKMTLPPLCVEQRS